MWEITGLITMGYEINVHLLPWCAYKRPLIQQRCTGCHRGPQSQSVMATLQCSDLLQLQISLLLLLYDIARGCVTFDLMFLQELCVQGPGSVTHHLVNVATVPQRVVAFVLRHHRVTFKLVGEFVAADCGHRDREDLLNMTGSKCSSGITKLKALRA